MKAFVYIIYNLCCPDLDGIVKYMRSKAGPSSKELKTVEDAAKFLDNTDHSIVGELNCVFASFL